MKKSSFILLLFIAFSITASAQFTGLPDNYGEVPKTRLKGAVHTVLTILQSGEHVHDTFVEVFDKSGRLVERLNSNANIEMHSEELVRLGGKSFFTYDSRGRLVKETYFTPEGKLIGYHIFVYNSKDFLVEVVDFNASGKERDKTTYTYFPETRQVEVKWSRIKFLLSYNEKNQMTKRTVDNRNTNLEYDKDGNLIKESPGDYWHNYSYKFDNQGNWIERSNEYVQLDKNGKEEVIPNRTNTYRIITYYSDIETKP